jgi:prophage regulatory protein
VTPIRSCFTLYFHQHEPNSPERILDMLEKYYRRPEVEQITGLSRSTIYDQIDRGEFPRPVRIGKRAVAWREADIAEWQAQRVHAA